MVLGQVISLFGNAILRFALSLYVLDLTQSATIFGSILALSMIPTILLSPVGGMIADRINRRNIMVALDFSTAVFIFLFLFFLPFSGELVLITLLMLLLSVIQVCYQPAVQASIPVLASEENLVQANGVVAQVNALSNLLGPILGGFLYAAFGFTPLVVGSGICFFASAVMELFLHIPFTKPENKGHALRESIGDLKQAVQFLTKGNRGLFQFLFVVAALNLFLSAMLTVGLPYLVKVNLGLSDQLYGFAQAALAVGMIMGGALSGTIAKKIKFQQSGILLLLSSISFLPIAFATFWKQIPVVSYIIIIAAVIIGMVFCALFNIFAQTFMQKETPNHMLGKVFAFVSMITTCALPIGQALYGVLFDAFPAYAAVLIACGAGVVLSIMVKGLLKDIKMSASGAETGSNSPAKPQETPAS